MFNLRTHGMYHYVEHCTMIIMMTPTRANRLASTVVLATEARDRFVALLNNLFEEHKPITFTEQALVETMAAARWRQMRLWCFQKVDLDREIARQSPQFAPPMRAAIAYRSLNDSTNSLSNAIRVESVFERQYYQAFKQLTFLKAHRNPSLDTAWPMQQPPPPVPDQPPTPPPPPSPEEAPPQKEIFPFGPNPKIEHPSSPSKSNRSHRHHTTITKPSSRTKAIRRIRRQTDTVGTRNQLAYNNETVPRLLFMLLGPSLFAADISYLREIQPLLQRQCQGCHQPSIKSSNLDLTTYDGFKKGGKRGPTTSTLIPYLTGEIKPQMPLGQPPLAPAEIDIVRNWIAAGAPNDTPAETLADDSKPIIYLQPSVINALAFSPDGKFLAVSGNREVLIHALDNSSPPIRLAGLSERILSLVYSKDGATLVAAGGTPARFGEVQLWDLKTNKLRRSITVTADTVFGASLSPDGTKVAVGCTDNTVRILDAATGKELHKIGNHENWVLGTVFGGDGKRIVSVGRDRAAKLTDATSGAFLENVNLLRGELGAIARNPSKEVVVVGGDDRTPYIYMMDRPKNMKIADDTTLIRKLERQAGPIAALAWSADGTYIAVAGASPEVTVYEAESGKRIAACKGHSAGIYAIAFSPDAQTLATGGFDGKVRMYNVKTGELAKSFVPVPLSAGVPHE